MNQRIAQNNRGKILKTELKLSRRRFFSLILFYLIYDGALKDVELSLSM